MARKRFITSDMSNDEDLTDIAETNDVLALMWPWFITAFDDWGRLDVTSPRQVKLDIFPLFPNITAKVVNEAIISYSKSGLVYKYSVNERNYLAIEPCKFYKYQTYIREEKRANDRSNYPAPISPPWENCVKCREGARSCAKVRADSTNSIPSPSPSPSPSPFLEREIDAHAPEDKKAEEEVTRKQKAIDKAIENINNKALGYGLSGTTVEFQQDAEMRLKEGTDSELIVKALSIGITNANGKAGAKCKYAIRVLQGWASEGIKTMAQWTEKNAPEGKAKDKPGKKSEIAQHNNFEQREHSQEYYDDFFTNRVK